MLPDSLHIHGRLNHVTTSVFGAVINIEQQVALHQGTLSTRTASSFQLLADTDGILHALGIRYVEGQPVDIKAHLPVTEKTPYTPPPLQAAPSSQRRKAVKIGCPLFLAGQPLHMFSGIPSVSELLGLIRRPSTKSVLLSHDITQRVVAANDASFLRGFKLNCNDYILLAIQGAESITFHLLQLRQESENTAWNLHATKLVAENTLQDYALDHFMPQANPLPALV